MKKLTKSSLAQMAALLPELDAEDQRCILGGTATTTIPPGYTGTVPEPTTTVPTTVDPYAVTGSMPTATTSMPTTTMPAVTGTVPEPTGMFTDFWENFMDQLGITGSYSGVTIYSERFQYSDNSTISKYYASSSDNCVELITGYLMEPAWDPSQSMISGSDRAIHPGEYEVSPYSSAKYKDNYILEDVSGRSYILIHQGNKPSHTEGCLMPGEYYSEDWVGRSGDAYKALNTFLKEYGEDGIRIIIKNQ